MIDRILMKNPELTVMISSASNGKVLTSTLSKDQTCENMANILSFTDKCKVLVNIRKSFSLSTFDLFEQKLLGSKNIKRRFELCKDQRTE